MSVRVVADPRRWAAFHCSGIYTLLMLVQESYEDMVGALRSDQLELAKYAARKTVLLCLRTRSLLAGGMPEDDGDVLADPFAELDHDIVESTLAAADGVIRVDDVAAARAAIPAVEAEVGRLARDLGLPGVPPSIRSPEGLFPALKLTRELLPINKSAGLPMVLPESWISHGAKAPAR